MTTQDQIARNDVALAKYNSRYDNNLYKSVTSAIIADLHGDECANDVHCREMVTRGEDSVAGKIIDLLIDASLEVCGYRLQNREGDGNVACKALADALPLPTIQTVTLFKVWLYLNHFRDKRNQESDQESDQEGINTVDANAIEDTDISS